MLLFSAGMPLLLPIFLFFLLTAVPFDRINLLGRYRAAARDQRARAPLREPSHPI